jgi:hypothetical protein
MAKCFVGSWGKQQQQQRQKEARTHARTQAGLLWIAFDLFLGIFSVWTFHT